jgi:hypothetical protein
LSRRPPRGSLVNSLEPQRMAACPLAVSSVPRTPNESALSGAEAFPRTLSTDKGKQTKIAPAPSFFKGLTRVKSWGGEYNRAGGEYIIQFALCAMRRVQTNVTRRFATIPQYGGYAPPAEIPAEECEEVL